MSSNDDSGRELWLASAAETVEVSGLEADISVDLAIVGGGFTGCSAALRAAEMGATVALLEARDIGYGGSGRNVGLVNAGLWMPPDDIVDQLGQSAGERLNQALAGAPDLVFQLVEENEIRCEARRQGTLHCAHSSTAMQALGRRLQQQLQRGAPVQLLDAEEARQRVGSPAVFGALFYGRAGTIQPLAYCRGLARAAQAKGASLFGQAAVDHLRFSESAWEIRSGQCKVNAKRLLIATNAYQHDLSGVSPSDYVPVYYFQLATEPLTPQQRELVLPGEEGCWDTALIMSSWRLDAAGRLIIGAMGNLDSSSGAVHEQWAGRKLQQLFPELATLPFTLGSCGRIAMTRDHLPKIVEAGPGAYMIFGYSGRGIGPGTLFGRSAAEALLSDDNSGLPLMPVNNYQESFTGLRGNFFESAALLNHWLGVRR